jgi:hypothetical protein
MCYLYGFVTNVAHILLRISIILSQRQDIVVGIRYEQLMKPMVIIKEKIKLIC